MESGSSMTLEDRIKVAGLKIEFLKKLVPLLRKESSPSTSEPAIVAEKSTFDALPPSTSASQSVGPLPILTPLPKSTPFPNISSFQGWISASAPPLLKSVPATSNPVSYNVLGSLPTSLPSFPRTAQGQTSEISRLPSTQGLPRFSSNAFSRTFSVESIQEDFLLSPPMRSIPSPSFLIPTRQATHPGMTVSCNIHPPAWTTLYVPTAVAFDWPGSTKEIPGVSAIEEDNAREDFQVICTDGGNAKAAIICTGLDFTIEAQESLTIQDQSELVTNMEQANDISKSDITGRDPSKLWLTRRDFGVMKKMLQEASINGGLGSDMIGSLADGQAYKAVSASKTVSVEMQRDRNPVEQSGKQRKRIEFAVDADGHLSKISITPSTRTPSTSVALSIPTPTLLATSNLTSPLSTLNNPPKSRKGSTDFSDRSRPFGSFCYFSSTAQSSILVPPPLTTIPLNLSNTHDTSYPPPRQASSVINSRLLSYSGPLLAYSRARKSRRGESNLEYEMRLRRKILRRQERNGTAIAREVLQVEVDREDIAVLSSPEIPLAQLLREEDFESDLSSIDDEFSSTDQAESDLSSLELSDVSSDDDQSEVVTFVGEGKNPFRVTMSYPGLSRQPSAGTANLSHHALMSSGETETHGAFPRVDFCINCGLGKGIKCRIADGEKDCERCLYRQKKCQWLLDLDRSNYSRCTGCRVRHERCERELGASTCLRCASLEEPCDTISKNSKAKSSMASTHLSISHNSKHSKHSKQPKHSKQGHQISSKRMVGETRMIPRCTACKRSKKGCTKLAGEVNCKNCNKRGLKCEMYPPKPHLDAVTEDSTFITKLSVSVPSVALPTAFKSNTSNGQTTPKDVQQNDDEYSLLSITGTGHVFLEENPLEEWCICAEKAAGSMVHCDSSDCEIQWFHLECTELDEFPEEGELWHCQACQIKSKRRKLTLW